jgi:gliding motility-associated-like protein
MKNFHILLFCIFFYNLSIIKSQTGCDFSAIRAAFAAPGHYTEVTGVNGQPCSMYFINTTSQDADLSEQEAQTLGAHMAVFNTAAENSAVTSAVYASFSGNIWIGYKRTSTGATTFYAMDGTTPSFTPGAATASFYQNWASGEPNNFQYQSCGTGCTGSLFFPCTNVYLCTNGEQCTQVYSNASWNDLPCNSNSTSIVEVNLCPVTTINPSSTIICGGGSVTLPCSTILGSAPYTYSWTSSVGGFTSTSANPTVNPTANTTYSVTATDRYGCTSYASVDIQVVPLVASISNVTAATCNLTCNGTATASASGGTGVAAYAYTWSTSPVQTNATASGLCAGTYTCTVNKGSCVASGAELVNNGDFNSGNTGFSSTYNYWAAGTTGDMSEGKYYVGINANTVHSAFTGSGRSGENFMVVNGANAANTTVWCQLVNVIPNTDYQFSTWVSTVHTGNPAQLQFSFNGINTGSVFTAPAVTGSWSQFFSSWNSGVSTTANICVVNQNTVANGNDFGLDDISFKSCVPACEDTVIVVIPNATVNIAPIDPVTICPNTSISLIADATGGDGTFTYSWAPAGTGNTAIVNVSPTVTTNYTVTVYDGNGCTAKPVAVTVTVNNILNVTVNSPSLCFGGSAVLIASGASNYTWMPASYLSSTTGATVTCTPTANMSYTVTGTSGGCEGSAVSTVSINPTPNSNAGNDITICSGVAGNIGTANTPGYLYSWLPASNLSSSTISNPLVNPTNYTANAITINYIVTTSPAGCFSKDTVLVTVNPSTDPTFFYSSSIFCKTANAANPSATTTTAGGVFTFSPAGLSIDVNTGLIDLLLSSLGTYTVTYSFNGACPSSNSTTITITDTPKAQFSYGTYCKNAANPVAQIAAGSSAGKFSSSAGLVFTNTSTGLVNLTASTAGTYTVTNTIVAGVNCSATIFSNTITINPVPVTLVDNQTVCNGTLVILTASGAVSYLWSDGSSGTTLTITAAGAASYTVIGNSLGCTSTAVGNISIKALPKVTVNNVTICVGQSTILNASGGATYSWLPGGTTASSLTITPSATTSYTVSDNTPGCSGFAVSNITVNILPIIAVNAPSICIGKSALLMASGAVTYLWIGGSSANPYTVSPTINTTYSVTGTSATGCIGKGNTNVTINALPIVTASSASICIGKSASLMASGARTYLWSNGSTANPLTISPSSTTTYTVTGNDVNGCINSGISTIKIFPKPIAQFSTSPEIATLFNPVVAFNNQSSVDVNYWFWDFGDGETLAGSAINPTHNYPEGDTGTFKAILIVHNAGFCYDTVNHFVKIGSEYSFYISNAFTPDGDGKNDLFFGKGVGILEYQLNIFDRWGNFIFTTNDIDKGWDGKANGGIEASQQDVYVWKVQLKDIHLKQHNYTGTVTILLGK